MITSLPQSRLERSKSYLKQAQTYSANNIRLLIAQATLYSISGESDKAMKFWIRAYKLNRKETEKQWSITHVKDLLSRNKINIEKIRLVE